MLKKYHIFFCPHCRKRVILKKGTRKIPHFAHQQNRDCAYFSEGETEQHLNGKLQLYDLFNRISEKAVLEGYIADIQQRPDILLSFQQKEYAIEFQCSSIPISRVIERNNGYLSHSIIPIWILLSPTWKTGNQLVVKLTSFQQFFITDSLLTYHPKTKSFTYLSNLLHIQSSTYIAKVDELPSHSQTWPLATAKKIPFSTFQSYLELYFRKRDSHLTNVYRYNQKGIQNTVLRICYHHRIQPSALPPFIGIPSRYASNFTEHACEWQLAWLDFLFRHFISIDEIRKEHYALFLREYKRKLTDIGQKTLAIQTYSSLLSDILIKQEGNFLLWEVNIRHMEHLLYKHFLTKSIHS